MGSKVEGAPEGVLYDVQHGVAAVFDCGNSQHDSHGLSHAALPADHFALVLGRDFQMENHPAVLHRFGHLDGVRIGGERPGYIFDQLFHRLGVLAVLFNWGFNHSGCFDRDGFDRDGNCAGPGHDPAFFEDPEHGIGWLGPNA